MPPELYWAAMVRGLSVIPVLPRGKKRPRGRWKQRQSTPALPAEVRHQWQAHPDDLWAVVTGDVSQTIVLDFDGPEGLETMRSLGLSPTVTTPSGGAHVWVFAPDVIAPTKTYGDTYLGMEVKAEGGKATFCGKPYGKRPYKFHGEHTIVNWDDLPDELRTYISTPTERPSAGRSATSGTNRRLFDHKFGEAVSRVDEGDGRNVVGYWLAQQLWWNDASEQTLRTYMGRFRRVVDQRDDPYTADEVADTIASVLKEPKREPEHSSTTPTLASTVVRSLGGVEPKSIDWLWPKRIAYGKVTNFEGDPAHGKSLVTLDLAARVTRGDSFPDDVSVRPGAVLLICAEDDLEDTIIPRLRSAGADMTRCFELHVRMDEDGLPIPFTLPDDMETLRRAIENVKAQSRLERVVVVVDPVSAYLSEHINSHNDASVRKATSPLAQLAGETGASFWLVRHLNKNSGEKNVAYRGGGSVAFFAAVRHAFVFGRDPDHPATVVMAQSKNNIGPRDQPSLQYQIEANDHEDGITDLRVAWLGRSNLSADEVLGGADRRTDAPQRDEAVRVLSELMTGRDELPVADANKACEQFGISKKSVERAAKKLDWKSERIIRGDGTIDHWVYRPLPGGDHDYRQR